MTQTRASARRRWPRMTYEEYLCAPDIPEHTEWVNGEVVEMMSVSKAHAYLTTYLTRLLGDYAEHLNLGDVLTEPFQLRLERAASGRAPDVIFVRAEHLDRVGDKFVDGPADLVVEVLSPGTERVDRGDKFYEYQAAGVPEYWILDPVREVADFYVLDDAGVYRSANVPPDGQFESTVLTGFRLQIKWLWSRPRVSSVLKELGVAL